MTDSIIINDSLPINMCFICEKPFLHRKRYYSCDGFKEIKEVEIMTSHPTCRSYERMKLKLESDIESATIEKKCHSREVRELNKNIKKMKQEVCDIEYKVFLKKYS